MMVRSGGRARRRSAGPQRRASLGALVGGVDGEEAVRLGEGGDTAGAFAERAGASPSPGASASETMTYSVRPSSLGVRTASGAAATARRVAAGRPGRGSPGTANSWKVKTALVGNPAGSAPACCRRRRGRAACPASAPRHAPAGRARQPRQDAVGDIAGALEVPPDITTMSAASRPAAAPLPAPPRRRGRCPAAAARRRVRPPRRPGWRRCCRRSAHRQRRPGGPTRRRWRESRRAAAAPTGRPASPAAASMPISRLVTGVPARSTASPRAMSLPAGRWPGPARRRGGPASRGPSGPSSARCARS